MRIGVVDGALAAAPPDSAALPGSVGPAYARHLLGALATGGDDVSTWAGTAASLHDRLRASIRSPPAAAGSTAPSQSGEPRSRSRSPSGDGGVSPAVPPPDAVFDTGPRDRRLGWLARRYAVPAGVPVVGVVDASFFASLRTGWRRRVDRAVRRHFLRSVDALVCDASSTLDRVDDLLGPGRPVPPAVVARPGRDRLPDAAEVTAGRVRARATEGPLDVAFAAPVTRSSGLLELVMGLDRVREEWRLTAVGDLDADPAYVDQVRAALVDLGLEGRVWLAGDLDDETLAATLAGAHLFAAPARSGGDGVALADALSFGLPAVATRDGIGGDLLTHRVDGVLVDPATEGEITDAIAPLCHDRARLARFGVAALSTARDLPTWADTARAVRTFVREHLSA